MTVQSLFPEQRRPVPTLKDAILDLQEDEENMKDAEFLREDIKRRPKYEWMHLLPKDDINNPWPVKQGAAYEELGQYVPDNKYFQTLAQFIICSNKSLPLQFSKGCQACCSTHSYNFSSSQS